VATAAGGYAAAQAMKRLTFALFSGLFALPLVACGGDDVKVAPPPPLPAMPVPKPAAAEPVVVPEAAADEPERPAPANPSRKLSKKEKAKLARAEAASKNGATPAAKQAKPAPAKPTTPAPAAKPAAPAPAPVVARPSAPAPAAAKSKVIIPRTANVNVDVPAGLQADLDKDPRMQPWVNQAVSVIDKCHTQQAAPAGTIEVLLTMHESARPTADIKKLPGALSQLVACATGGLMSKKMPLFTGKEGTRYTVKINFNK